MFLNYLSEESKEDFLKLCVYAALSNEEFAEEEKEMFGLQEEILTAYGLTRQ